MLLRSACCVGALVALSISPYAQTRPSSPAPTNPGLGGTAPSPSRSPFPTTPTPSTTTPNQTNQRPIFLSGKVMMDDGTPPPESVAIQRICNTSPHTETYTDSKGNFSFQLGQELGVTPDASEQTWGTPQQGASTGMNGPSVFGGNTGMTRDPSMMLMGCTLRAQLAGFRSESVSLTNHRSLDDPNVGVIILHRLGKVEGQTISATSAMAPKDAKKAYEKALNDIKKQKWDSAEKELEKATETYPKYAAAWFELGLIEERSENLDAARNCFQKALEADARFLKPYEQLSRIQMHDQRWQDAKDTTSRLVHLDPYDYPEAWYFNAIANYRLKNYEAAEKSVREGIKVDNDHVVPRANQLLAVLLAEKQDYAGAAQSLKNYLQVAPNGPDAETVKKQLAAVEQRLQASAPKQENEEKQ